MNITVAARPHGRLVRVRDALTPREWARAGAMAATIIGLHVLGWGMLAAAAGGHYHITGTQFFGFGTGVLAYTLGIRHAFDADHIAVCARKQMTPAPPAPSPRASGPATRHCAPGSLPPSTAPSNSPTRTPGCAASLPGHLATSGQHGPDQVTIQDAETPAIRPQATRR